MDAAPRPGERGEHQRDQQDGVQEGEVAQDVPAALRTAAANGTRIASICVGAFTLAATELLDGLRATTHWAAAGELARRYPAVAVDANVLFVDNGQILTSAGAAAGLDLCLHMIRNDHGSAVAADAARIAVMPLERDGGQAQFIVREPPTPRMGRRSNRCCAGWKRTRTGSLRSPTSRPRR